MISESINLPFVEKYRPKSFDDFIGNRNKVKEIELWFRNWNREKKKAVLLVGPAGTGKTSVALYLAKKYKYEFIEVNASDKRNKKAVELLVGKASTEGTVLQGGTVRKMIVVDEIDGLFGNQDRGGGKAIEKAIKNTRIPIIATANDIEAKSISSAKKLMKVVEFHRLSSDELLILLKRIVENEKLEIKDEILFDIAKNSFGDARSALNDLESIAFELLPSSFEFEFSQRNQEQKLQQALSKIYSAKSLTEAREAIEGLDADYRELLNYVDEHTYKQAKSPEELDNMYSLIAEADFYLSQAYISQNWLFLKYFYVFISSVGLLKSSPYKQVRYTFPSYWAKIGRLRMKEAKLLSIIKKSKAKFHCSSSQFRQDIYPYMRIIFRYDASMAAGIATWLDLDEGEIDFLTGKEKKQTKLILQNMEDLYIDFAKEVVITSPLSEKSTLITHFNEKQFEKTSEQKELKKEKRISETNEEKIITKTEEENIKTESDKKDPQKTERESIVSTEPSKISDKQSNKEKSKKKKPKSEQLSLDNFF